MSSMTQPTVTPSVGGVDAGLGPGLRSVRAGAAVTAARTAGGQGDILSPVRVTRHARMRGIGSVNPDKAVARHLDFAH